MFSYKKLFVVSGATGIIGSLIFNFIFPRGAINTLMHEVLHLPGPGAGIALVLGPFVIICAIAATFFLQGFGVASLTTLFFALTTTILNVIYRTSAESAGKFGSIEFIGGLLLFGLLLDALLHLLQQAKFFSKILLSCCIANLFLLAYYWVVIFPQTKGWVRLNDAIILALVSLVGAIISTVIVMLTGIFRKTP